MRGLCAASGEVAQSSSATNHRRCSRDEVGACIECIASVCVSREILDAAWDTEWRRSAADDPEAGFGDDGEADVVNSVGSALFLAASLPDIYGVPGTPPMRCFGFPLLASLLSWSPAQTSFGVGVVDN